MKEILYKYKKEQKENNVAPNGAGRGGGGKNKIDYKAKAIAGKQ